MPPTTSARQTPGTDAAMFNHTSVQLGLLRELLGAGASVAPRGMQKDTALPAWRTRVSHGPAAGCRRLPQRSGAACLAWGGNPPPPLLAAVCYGAPPACLRALLAAGAHPDAPCVVAAGGAREEMPRMALQQALEAEGGGSAPAVAALLQAGALCWPSRHCSEDVLRLLLGAGVSVHASGACKTALLTHALHRGDIGDGPRWIAAPCRQAQWRWCCSTPAPGGWRWQGLAGLGHLLLCRAARKGHGAGVLELLAAGADARGRDLKGVLALAHLRAAEGKRRNEGKDRGKEYQRAVAALTAATGTAEGGGG